MSMMCYIKSIQSFNLKASFSHSHGGGQNKLSTLSKNWLGGVNKRSYSTVGWYRFRHTNHRLKKTSVEFSNKFYLC